MFWEVVLLQGLLGDASTAVERIVFPEYDKKLRPISVPLIWISTLQAPKPRKLRLVGLTRRSDKFEDCEWQGTPETNVMLVAD